ncbi:unnamed protein product [Polarella glacialis]|uniref:Uncharacterized protein n=1 Tax=Polarella glacialis TaxID=89957 RepID=A0A813DJA7_POLGL|nr:unnamed protein product [Polarella glacialis]
MTRAWMLVKWEDHHGMDDDRGQFKQTVQSSLQRAQYLYLHAAANALVCEIDSTSQFISLVDDILCIDLDRITEAPRNSCEVHFLTGHPPSFKSRSRKSSRAPNNNNNPCLSSAKTSSAAVPQTSSGSRSSLLRVEGSIGEIPPDNDNHNNNHNNSSNNNNNNNTSEGMSSQTCIQDVVHEEPAAEIDPQEAEETVQEQWAQLVEIMLQGRLAHQEYPANEWVDLDPGSSSSAHEVAGADVRALEYGEALYLVCMSRVTEQFCQVLQRGGEFDQVRVEMERHRFAWQIEPPGAFVFTHPDQYQEAIRLVRKIRLKSHHVVICQSFMPLLREALSRLPSKMHVRQRSLDEIALIPDDGMGGAVIVKKTFICHQVSAVEQVATQSAPAASRDKNPRLCAPSEI